LKEVLPYTPDRSKKEQVAEMFNNIAHSYDFLNHFFSLGIDKIWRKKAIKMLREEAPQKVLDVATGTGDFAMEAVRMNLASEKIIGVDISEGMLAKGREKIAAKGWQERIELRLGDSENLPFEPASFDGIMVAFGVRNFQNLQLGLTDMARVLKPNGTLIVLEFSKPKNFPMKQLFGFYFKVIMPGIGRLVSKDHRAYTYLPESVNAFPEGEEFLSILKKCGYSQCTRRPVGGGIATIYKAKK
jgi:demethylmenaquinone methyltransferase / 2-methoxy-6-polyprenyl-1,4-benzoquinol methylase